MLATTTIPRLIQGGMGIGVSDWRLARAVSAGGQLGVVSGALLDTLLVRRLQDGDPGGHLRRAMAAFPIPGVAEAVLRRYFVDGGIGPRTPYRLLPMWRQRVSGFREQIAVLAAFVEVRLARDGHDGRVGLNLLTKIQLPNLATLYGAMLAGVGAVLMGAGIPKEIPGALDALAAHRPAELRFDIDGAPREPVEALRFDPARLGAPAAALERPPFLAIVSSNALAASLLGRSRGRIDGFVVEGPTAGGHNAPPRGGTRLDPRAEPVYGERDRVDLDKLRALGLPFWLAGGMGSPQALRSALAAGAAGVQVGTLFAFCDESGLAPTLKAGILGALHRGAVTVTTDPVASPTGYPFKRLHWAGEPDELRGSSRPRRCDLGYLRTPFVASDGGIGYRCPAEPEAEFVAKGGDGGRTNGCLCLCNGLLAGVARGQWRDGPGREPPVVTCGSELADLRAFLAGRTSYRAREVIDWIMGTGHPRT